MQQEVDKDRTNVFVKYLPPEVDSDGLEALFESYGTIVSAKVMVNQETGASLGYGYLLLSFTSFYLPFTSSFPLHSPDHDHSLNITQFHLLSWYIIERNLFA